MAEIPKIVMQRLQRKLGEEVHPDADLITAFAENSLQKNERLQVLAHLARCADCREIAALSLPEFVPAATSAMSPASGWLSWPVLRWGTAVACVLVVGAAVGLHYRARPASDAEASLQRSDGSGGLSAASRATAPKAELSPLAASPAPGQRAESGDHFAGRAVAPERRDQRMILGQAAPQASLSEEKQVREKLDAISPAESAPAAADLKKTESALSDTTLPDNKVAVGGAAAADDLFRNEMGQMIPGRAKDAEPEKSDRAQVSAMAVNRQQAPTVPIAPRTAPLPLAAGIVPRWTLSADGKLQRSLDSGRSWETIAFPSQITFRSLAANGLDIWVGGTRGVLYHSADAGQRWKQVQPAVGGKPLTADIIRVDFPDSLHGSLSTSDQQIWVTSDAGQTWQKQ